MLYYSIANYLAGTDVTISVSSEDALYVQEWLYNKRPSKPFRFTGHGTAGNPEYICIEFDAPKLVEIAALFNHNLTALAAANDEVTFKGCDDPCDLSGSGACDWDTPDYEHDLKPHLVTGWNDVYHVLSQTRLAYRFDFIDSTNADGYVEVGEAFLGALGALSTAHLKPGRAESPQLYRAANVTPYGQHWTEAFSHSVTLDLTVTNLNDPATVDAVRTMLLAVHANGGVFVVVPNHRFPFVYYVHLESDGGFMAQVVRGQDCEWSEWTFNLRTLTKGIVLL